jgi:hypothetical protein
MVNIFKSKTEQGKVSEIDPRRIIGMELKHNKERSYYVSIMERLSDKESVITNDREWKFPANTGKDIEVLYWFLNNLDVIPISFKTYDSFGALIRALMIQLRRNNEMHKGMLFKNK